MTSQKVFDKSILPCGAFTWQVNSYLRQKHTVNTVTMGFYEPLKKLTSRIQEFYRSNSDMFFQDRHNRRPCQQKWVLVFLVIYRHYRSCLQLFLQGEFHHPHDYQQYPLSLHTDGFHPQTPWYRKKRLVAPAGSDCDRSYCPFHFLLNGQPARHQQVWSQSQGNPGVCLLIWILDNH